MSWLIAFGKYSIPNNLGFLLDFNPIAILIKMYRDVLMHNQGPSLFNLTFVGGSSLFILIIALIFIKKNRNAYAMALAK